MNKDTEPGEGWTHNYSVAPFHSAIKQFHHWITCLCNSSCWLSGLHENGRRKLLKLCGGHQRPTSSSILLHTAIQGKLLVLQMKLKCSFTCPYNCPWKTNGIQGPFVQRMVGKLFLAHACTMRINKVWQENLLHLHDWLCRLWMLSSDDIVSSDHSCRPWNSSVPLWKKPQIWSPN